MTDVPSFMNVGPERIDPERLRLVLLESGWKVAGQRTGAYVRLLPPEEGQHSVLVPLDRQAPDYAESMRAALADIGHLTVRDFWASNVAARLVVEPSDSFRFRAESAAPSGLIPWTHGERLIRSARRVLSAGAKTHLEHLKYFGNRFGQFANRYLEMVLMGQTAPGSYIVTAFTPANGFVQISGAHPDAVPMFTLPEEVASTRSIGISVILAAEATKEAVDHYRQQGSLAGFDDLVPRGVSYEITTALSDLVTGSDGAEISVEWDPVLDPPRNVPSARIEFLPSDVEVLTRASTELAANVEPPTVVTIMGRVHLLTRREAGGPGVIGIENLAPEKPKKLRVHLNDEDYHIALRAHDRDDAVVQGRMEREGNIYWLYDGRLVRILGSVVEIQSELGQPPLEDDPNQMEFGSIEDDTSGNLSERCRNPELLRSSDRLRGALCSDRLSPPESVQSIWAPAMSWSAATA